MRFSLGNFIWRIVDLIIAAIFIYAGVLKALDPVQLAHDIDHYKILPWTVGVGLAFYLPWLEIFCGLALIFRLFYRGALSILTALVVVFLVATIAAKVRGLDITCGCFGHASQNWSFPAHLALDLANSRCSGCALLLQRSASACKCFANAYVMRFGIETA